MTDYPLIQIDWSDPGNWYGEDVGSNFTACTGTVVGAYATIDIPEDPPDIAPVYTYEIVPQDLTGAGIVGVRVELEVESGSGDLAVVLRATVGGGDPPILQRNDDAGTPTLGVGLHTYTLGPALDETDDGDPVGTPWDLDLFLERLAVSNPGETPEIFGDVTLIDGSPVSISAFRLIAYTAEPGPCNEWVTHDLSTFQSLNGNPFGAITFDDPNLVYTYPYVSGTAPDSWYVGLESIYLADDRPTQIEVTFAADDDGGLYGFERFDVISFAAFPSDPFADDLSTLATCWPTGLVGAEQTASNQWTLTVQPGQAAFDEDVTANQYRYVYLSFSAFGVDYSTTITSIRTRTVCATPTVTGVPPRRLIQRSW